jgi:hypothetical protein
MRVIFFASVIVHTHLDLRDPTRGDIRGHHDGVPNDLRGDPLVYFPVALRTSRVSFHVVPNGPAPTRSDDATD